MNAKARCDIAPACDCAADALELRAGFVLSKAEVFGCVEKHVNRFNRNAGVKFKRQRLRTLQVRIQVIRRRQAPSAVLE